MRRLLSSPTNMQTYPRGEFEVIITCLFMTEMLARALRVALFVFSCPIGHASRYLAELYDLRRVPTPDYCAKKPQPNELCVSPLITSPLILKVISSFIREMELCKVAILYSTVNFKNKIIIFFVFFLYWKWLIKK